MSNLPHPLGDSTPGDLFYPGSPSVTVSDSPGAAGSRAVEYGEDGYSAAANRGLYALGKNDEYMQERLETKMAHISFTEWTPSGGNGDEYVFSAVDVFVGGSNYLPETQAIRESLISVLDGDYNELIDPATGDKIVVKEILNSAKTASIVGDPTAAGGDEDGFYNSGATIHFRRAHPVTGVLGADYTIPNSTDVILVHGISGTLDTLATGGSEHLMRGAFVEGSIRSAQELPAGAFLLDGSRKAIGDFDMDTYAMIGDTFYGHGSNPLQIGDASGERIWFRDAWQNCYLNNAPSWDASGHETGLQGAYTSILGSLNAATVVNQHWCGNRTTNKVGSFSYTDGTGQIDYPILRLQLNGQYIVIPSDSIIANNTGSTIEYLVITASGTVAKKAAAAVIATDIIVEEHVWNGSAFTSHYDLRWPVSRTQNTLEITCGDGAGADFSDFAEAVTVGRELARVGKEIDQLKIKIIGTATWGDNIDLDSSQDAELCIQGDGWGQSIINITASVTIDLDSTSSGTGVPVYCEKVCFNWTGASGMTTYVFSGLGDGSRIKDCKFTRSSTGLGKGVASTNLTDTSKVIISDCVIENWISVFYSSTVAICDNFLAINCCGSCVATGGILFTVVGKDCRISHCVFNGDYSCFVDFEGSGTDNSGFVVVFNHVISTKAAANTDHAIYIDTAQNFDGIIAFNTFKNFRMLLEAVTFSGDNCRCDVLYNRLDNLTHDTSAWAVLIDTVSATVGNITVKGNSTFNSITTLTTKFFSISSVSYNCYVNIIDNIIDEGIAVYIDTDNVTLHCNGNTFKAPTLVDTSNSIIQAPTSSYSLVKGSEISNNYIYRRAQATTAISVKGIGSSVCDNSIINSDDDPNFNLGTYGTEIGVNTVMDVTATPPSPVVGERYLVYQGATGDWAGQDGKIAEVNVSSVWEFVTPTDQTMVWAESILGSSANYGWYCHYGTHSGWGGTGNQGWYACASIGIAIDAVSGDANNGVRCRGNKIVSGIHGIIVDSTNGQISITDNFLRDLQGYGVNENNDGADVIIGYNSFFNVHGYGVESVLAAAAMVINLITYSRSISSIIGNQFENCGHRWEEEDDAFLINAAGDGGKLIANNAFSQIQGCGDSITNVIYTDNSADIIGNRISHEYGKAGATQSQPYYVRAIHVVGSRSTIWGNHIYFYGTPAGDAVTFYGIYVHGTASFCSVCMNMVDMTGVGTLTTIKGIDCYGSGCLAVGNSTGDETYLLTQHYESTTINGFSACNYAHGSAVTGVLQLPPNSVSAPVDLWDELNP